MPQIYDWITTNETQNINNLATYVNTVTDGLFLPLILLAFFIIIFVVSLTVGVGRAFVFASFFSAVIAIFMVVGGWLNPIYMYLLFVMLGVALMAMRLIKSSPLPQI